MRFSWNEVRESLTPTRVGVIAPGHVLVPFHYGHWDEKEHAHTSAANELTVTGWDLVSEQPHLPQM
jgi:hypothetical protein